MVNIYIVHIETERRDWYALKHTLFSKHTDIEIGKY